MHGIGVLLDECSRYQHLCNACASGTDLHFRETHFSQATPAVLVYHAPACVGASQRVNLAY